MTLKQRIRELCESLGPDEWLTAREIAERLTGDPAAVATLVWGMHNAGQLERDGTRCHYVYRAGSERVRATTRGRRARIRTGFMYLSRLRESDPAAYERAVAEDQGRG